MEEQHRQRGCIAGRMRPDLHYVLRLHPLTNGPGETHALERRVDNLYRAASVRVVWRLGFEQLRVREDDPELVVQSMKQARQICRGEAVIVAPKRSFRHPEQRGEAHAAGVAEVNRDWPSGWRQRLSTKIRILPPAVRTYSTLPAAIQL